MDSPAISFLEPPSSLVKSLLIIITMKGDYVAMIGDYGSSCQLIFTLTVGL